MLRGILNVMFGREQTWCVISLVLVLACGGRVETDEAPASGGNASANTAIGAASDANTRGGGTGANAAGDAGESPRGITTQTDPGSTQDPPGWIHCGDGVVDIDERCDDANRFDGDGCSAKCIIEQGYVCPRRGGACIKSG
jgi:cysteine-rich repeat protein